MLTNKFQGYRSSPSDDAHYTSGSSKCRILCLVRSTYAAAVIDMPNANLSPVVRASAFKTAYQCKVIPAPTNVAPPMRCVQLFIISMWRHHRSWNNRLYELVGRWHYLKSDDCIPRNLYTNIQFIPTESRSKDSVPFFILHNILIISSRFLLLMRMFLKPTLRKSLKHGRLNLESRSNAIPHADETQE
jgi:hypothetical protein